MSVYYNENDPKAATWLRDLMAQGHLPKGHVDDRSITEVRPDDIEGFDQFHFFAGIGGWPLALRWAGWPDERPVWTGSCPCQPFSVSGQGRAYRDDRHLAPVWLDLIAECRPAAIFGEQVASADGRAWLGALRAELERLGYVAGAADLCAAGVGAPHIRQRLYFGAHRIGAGWPALAGDSEPGSDELGNPCCEGSEEQRRQRVKPARFAPAGDTGRLGDQPERGRGEFGDAAQPGSGGHVDRAGNLPGRLADARRQQWQRGRSGEEGEQPRPVEPVERFCDAGTLAHGPSGQPSDRDLQRGGEHRQRAEDGGISGPAEPDQGQRRRLAEYDGHVLDGEAGGRNERHGEPERDRATVWPGAHHAGWDDVDWLGCTDGKWRPVEPGSFPLAHGIPARVGRLRGYGNAIVPQLAAEFVKAFEEASAG